MIAEMGRMEGFPVWKRQASMGPRSNDRGNTTIAPEVDHCALLQWGRDQMIAEIRVGRQGSGDDPRASMGPRSNDRGNARNRSGYRRISLASMGPRSNDRGNELRQHLLPTLEPCFNGAAIK